MTEPCLHSAAEQDRICLELYDILQRIAPKYTRKDHVDDVVHEIVVRVLGKIEKGTWTQTGTIDEAFVHALLANHMKNRLEKRRRGAALDAEHLRARELEPPAWMSADCGTDEDMIAEVQQSVLEKLPRLCCMAYWMVRMENASYREAAVRLHRSPKTVHNYIVAANKAFRLELQRLGLVDTHQCAANPNQRVANRNQRAAGPHQQAADLNGGASGSHHGALGLYHEVDDAHRATADIHRGAAESHQNTRPVPPARPVPAPLFSLAAPVHRRPALPSRARASLRRQLAPPGR